MSPTIYQDLEIKVGARVKHEIQEQFRNDKDHTTSNTEQKTSTTRVQQENKEHNATRPLSRCYLRSYLVKITTGTQKEPSKKYKSNLEEPATSNAELNTSIARV